MKMWMVEAKTFGEESQFFRYGPVSEAESRKIHNDLFTSGEWATVCSWKIASAQGDEEFLKLAQEIEDGIGEGQSL
jgi:hypothetical protein